MSGVDIKRLQSFGSSTGKQTLWIYTASVIRITNTDEMITAKDYFKKAVDELGMRSGDLIISVEGWLPYAMPTNTLQIKMGIMRYLEMDPPAETGYYFYSGLFNVGKVVHAVEAAVADPAEVPRGVKTTQVVIDR